MAQRSTDYRYRTRVTYAKPIKAHKKRFRGLRRLVITLLVLSVFAFIVQSYLLNVYAPGLRSEARTVPGLVRAQMQRENSPYLPITSISPYLRNAIIAVEDRRFYSHPGVDPLGIARAFWVDMTDGHKDQGGSTLEEQLAKRAIVHNDSNIHDKVRTMALAWAIDQEFSKPKILELYLNAAYYGRGAYGAQEAARIYFGIDASQLTIAQAAFLAALPQAPSIYGANPSGAPIVNRQQSVLQDMQQQGYISSAQEASAENTHLAFAFPNP